MADKEPKTVKADSAKDDDGASEAAKSSTNAKQIPWLVLAVGILVMLVTPTASYFLVKLTMATPEAATSEGATHEGGKKEGGKEEGAKHEGGKKEGGKKEGGKEEGGEKESGTFNLPFMLINIAETKGTRILKITPHLIFSEPEMANKMPPLKPLLMDTITTVASGKTLDELDGPTGRENLKKVIIQRLNKLLETRMTGSVVDIYFEEFLIN